MHLLNSPSMHPHGPPRKFFRPSGSRGGARIPNPGGTQDFTVDQDTPPGGFHQSQPYRLPPPPVGAPRYGFPPGPWPPFNPYPPPRYGYHPRPPGFGAPPRHWGRGGYGYQGRGGGWRGRGRGRGYRGRGGRYPYSKHGGDSGASDDIDAYYSKSMFEDPWKDLLPQEGEQSQEAPVPTSISLNSTTSNQDSTSQGEEMAALTVDTTSGTIDIDKHSDSSCNIMIENSSGVDIDSIGTGNEAGAPSDDSMLAQTNDLPTNCIEDDCADTTVGSGDHLCVASTDQESSQIKEST